MVTNVPITTGTGAVSVAAETVAGVSFQRIEVLGQGGASVMSVNPDGSINASIIGTPTISFIAKAGSVMSVTNPAGSVTQIRTDNASVITTAPPGSVLTVATLAGSVTAVSATFPAGSVTTVTNPAGSITSTTNPAGSITAVIMTAAAGSILSVTTPAGSVTQVRTDNASVITTQPAGSVMAVSAVQPAASLMAVINPAGSVTGIRTDSASVIVVPQQSSIITVFSAPSVVGTWQEDAAHTSGDRGILALSVRNDTLASVTSADGDYGAIALGPSGEVVVANSPLTKWVSGTASMLGGVPMNVSVTVIAAQGASIFTYVTGIQVANMGSASVLVSFGGATSSIIGYTIAPAGGGSNIPMSNAMKTNANGAFSASISGTASIYISAQGFISKS